MGFLFCGSVLLLCIVPNLLINISREVMGLLMLTGVFEAIYFVGLASSYRTGDMTAVYPIVRALPILIVALFSILSGHGQAFSIYALVGMLLIVIGCLLVPIDHEKQIGFRHYLTRTNIFAMLAAAGTSGYMLVDDTALKILRSVSALSVAQVWITVLYTMLSFSSTFIILGSVVLASKEQRLALKSITKQQIGRSSLTGLMILVTYLLVLISLAHVRDVSYATAFRQVSVIFGLLLGMLLLKEKPGTVRISGTLLIFVGLVLVALG